MNGSGHATFMGRDWGSPAFVESFSSSHPDLTAQSMLSIFERCLNLNPEEAHALPPSADGCPAKSGLIAQEIVEL